MTVLTGSEFKTYGIVEPLDENSVQAGGYDLRLNKIKRFVNSQLMPCITVDNADRVVLETEEVLWNKKFIDDNLSVWLPQGQYAIEFYEVITIPDDCIGFIYPRSSLLRSNATITTAVWDAGYSGRGVGYLMVNGERGLRLERYAAVAQLVIHRMTEPSDKLYDGIYQNEGK